MSAIDLSVIDISNRSSCRIKNNVTQFTSFSLYFPNINDAMKCLSNCNGHPFDNKRNEICHAVYISELCFSEIDQPVVPPKLYAELPLCPVCLERIDSSISGIISP